MAGVSRVTELNITCHGVDLCPHRLHCFAGEIDGWRRTWKLYLPEHYDQMGKRPLIASLHGGDYQTMHEYAAWHLLAERENIIILYPESLVNGVGWNCWDALSAADGRADDVAYLDQLLEYVIENYPVDESRVYMHGQSMGDMMATYYAFCHPERLAGVAPFSGPTKTRWFMRSDGTMMFTPAAPLPVIRMHGECDNFQLSGLTEDWARLRKRQCHIEINNNLWKTVNRCAELPLISTTEQRNVERYTGKDGADLIFVATPNGQHRPPADFIEDIWRNLVCCWRRENGRLIRLPDSNAWQPDHGGVALFEGSGRAYVDHCLKEPMGCLPAETGEDGILRFDIHMLPQLVPAVSHVMLRSDKIRIRTSMETIDIFPQSALALRAGIFSAMKPLVLKPETCMVPFEDMMRLFGMCAHTAYGAGYAVGHPFSLTYDLCHTIGTILGRIAQPDNATVYAQEAEIYAAQCAEKQFAAPRNRLEEIWQWCHTV